MSAFLAISGGIVAFLIVNGLLAESDEGREINWSIAAIVYTFASLTALAVMGIR